MTAKTDYGPGTPENPFPEYATPEEVADIAGSTGSISDAIDEHAADASDPHSAADYASGTDITDAVATHAGASDPHAAYTKQGEVDTTVTTHDDDTGAHSLAGFALGDDITTAISDHTADLDPHSVYETSTEVAAKITTHAAVTTSVHGITNTASLETTTGSAAKVSTHSAAADPHGDRAYADGVASGLTVKDSVVAATTANITLSGAQTIDGVAVVAGNRVLVKDQSTTKNNGIYVAASSAWARATDADTTGEMKVGAFTYVSSGTTNGTASFVCNSAGTLDTDPVAFTQFNQAGSVSAGAGLVKSGSVINLVSSDSSLTISADDVAVASSHAGSTHAAATAAATAVSFPVVRPATGGTSDDTASVQGAIDALPVTGGTVVLDPGTVYTIKAGVTAKTITAAVYAASPETVTFTTSVTHGVVADDVVNVINAAPVAYNQCYRVKSVSSGAKTITCYADGKGDPGAWTSGGTVTGAGLKIIDKGGIVFQGAASRSQGTASGSWLKSGSSGMVMVVCEKSATTVMTHSGPTFKDVGFIDTAVDVNLQTGVTASWAAGTITFHKTSHGFATNDVVHVFNSSVAAYDSTTSYTVTRVDADNFTAPLATDPVTESGVTTSVAYETLPSGNTPNAVGLVIAGATRWKIDRCMFSGMRFGILMQTANSKDTSWGEVRDCVWHQCVVGYKVLGNGGQSAYVDGGNLIMHTGQIGFQGPQPQESSNDLNHFRCTGLKFDTQYTSGAACMGFDISLAQYVYLGHHSFEMEATSTTRCVRLGSAKATHGTIVGMECQHNNGGSGAIDGTAIEVAGTGTTNPAQITIIGGHYTNFKEAIHIGPYAFGCQVLGGTQSCAVGGATGVKIDNNSTVLGTVIVGFTSARKTSSSFTLLDIPSGSDTRYIDCWDYKNGSPVWWTDGVINKKAGAPSGTAGTEFVAFQDGQMQLDTTNSKLYVRTGGAWKSATLA